MNLLETIVIVLTLTQCSVHSAAPGIKSNHLSQRESRIVGGHTAVPHSHPYIISLQLQVLWISAHFCGGSLVSEKWVVTAAHCVTESYLIKWLHICAVAGAQDVDKITEGVQIQKIVERIPHPDYKGGVGPNDIAMLRTEHPFKYSAAVQPIRLPPQNVNLTSGFLVLSGWGVIKSAYFFPILPDQLQELNVTYVPYKSEYNATKKTECFNQVDYFTEFYEENTLNSVSNICTGPFEGGKAACSGDSGGPLTLIVSSNSDTTESSSQSISTTESSTSSESSTIPKSSTTTESSTTSKPSITPKSTTTTQSSTTRRSTTPPSSTASSSTSTGTVTESENAPYGNNSRLNYRNKYDKYFSSKRNTYDTNSSSSGNYTEYLVGVVSWGIYPCGEHGAPTVYTDVSTYRDFIKRYMNSDE